MDAAIEKAFALSQKLDSAQSLVEELTAALAKSVAARTEGLVEVSIEPVSRFDTTVRGILGYAAALHQTTRQREIGDDREDRQVRQFVIASVGGVKGTTRALWEVALDPRSGYPVTIHGPEEDDSVSCFSEADVREAFVAAAGHGLVGRKIAALYEHAKRRREATEAANVVAKADEEE